MSFPLCRSLRLDVVFINVLYVPLPVQPSGLAQSRVSERPDEAGLLPLLSRHSLCQTLLQLLFQRHEGLPREPGGPGSRVAEPDR